MTRSVYLFEKKKTTIWRYCISARIIQQRRIQIGLIRGNSAPQYRKKLIDFTFPFSSQILQFSSNLWKRSKIRMISLILDSKQELNETWYKAGQTINFYFRCRRLLIKKAKNMQTMPKAEEYSERSKSPQRDAENAATKKIWRNRIVQSCQSCETVLKLKTKL